MAEYSMLPGDVDPPPLLLDMVADVSATDSTVLALRLLLCEAAAGYACYPAACPVRYAC